MTSVLEVEHLVVRHHVRGGRTGAHSVTAVDSVGLSVEEGTILGVVGESGSGKTTLARSILRLIDPAAGRVVFDGTDIADLRGSDLRRARRGMQMVFQDPYGSLSPRQSVGQMLDEAISATGVSDRAERRRRSEDLIARVGLPTRVLEATAHDLSGGQRQRVAIARALSARPRLLICDEPVSALDVSVRGQILNLLLDLRDEGLAILLIAHDLGVVRLLADRVAVMYLGRIVEMAATESLFARPLHPYTRALIASIPDPSPFVDHDLAPIEGEIPDPAHPPSGCRFRTRCSFRRARCEEEEPLLRIVEDDHRSACHFAEELGRGALKPTVDAAGDAAPIQTASADTTESPRNDGSHA